MFRWVAGDDKANSADYKPEQVYGVRTEVPGCVSDLSRKHLHSVLLQRLSSGLWWHQHLGDLTRASTDTWHSICIHSGYGGIETSSFLGGITGAWWSQELGTLPIEVEGLGRTGRSKQCLRGHTRSVKTGNPFFVIWALGSAYTLHLCSSLAHLCASS